MGLRFRVLGFRVTVRNRIGVENICCSVALQNLQGKDIGNCSGFCVEWVWVCRAWDVGFTARAWALGIIVAGCRSQDLGFSVR